MERIKIPFNLPCHLKVTSFRRATGSHSTGNTIDLVIFPEGDTYPKQVAEYIRTYTELFGHLRYGVLRINAERSNWHYHLEANRDKYESGEEHFAYKNGNYYPVAPIKKIDHMRYSGALARYSKMIDDVTARLFGTNTITSIFSLGYWQEFIAYWRLKNKDVTYIYFDPDSKKDDRITENELLSILNCFDGDYTQTILSTVLPGSPLEQGQFKSLLVIGAMLAGIIYFTRDEK
jgi:hypothetical protein